MNQQKHNHPLELDWSQSLMSFSSKTDILSKIAIFQRQLSIIKSTLNYPPIRNNLTSASLLSMLIETDYLNYPPIRNNLSSASLPLSCAGAILKILNSI